MTGSFLVPIVVPIVAVVALAIWIGLVFWADAHPGWKAHGVAPGSEVTGARLTLPEAESAAYPGSELAPSLRDRKAA
jgi:hypothetical protein